MSLLKICLLVLGTTIIQSIGWILNIYPLTYFDLPLIITVYVSMKGRRVHSSLTGSLFGLTQDAVQGLPLGIHGFAMTLTGYVIAVVSKKVVMERQGSRGLVLFLASLGNSLVVFLLLLMIGRHAYSHFFTQAVIQSVVTSILGVVILQFFQRRASALTKRFKTPSPKYGSTEKY
ncbi:MAG: rod shape-determining protein MreD [Acidobacteria bacterium]|nr:rod shape-determining protein MreD [Acidobacteriota bacterium]MBI3655798.1 rod shape-determining protein MreD [Acidobacteriota bacterium]